MEAPLASLQQGSRQTRLPAKSWEALLAFAGGELSDSEHTKEPWKVWKYALNVRNKPENNERPVDGSQRVVRWIWRGCSCKEGAILREAPTG
jgi:hypothetical protein